jgi:hypothetical protein
MSKRSGTPVGLVALVLILTPASRASQDTQTESRLKWHTYAGSSVHDNAEGVAVDPSGNVYLTGWSDATWGSPILPHSGGRDAFVAKLSANGNLVWNTFVASYHPEPAAGAIAVDAGGGVYVVVTSTNDAGRPSALLVKLDADGEVQWQRFMTTLGGQVGTSVFVDAAGNIYVGGWGGSLWDTPPVEPFPYSNGAFVAKLSSSGVEVWHALMGSWPGPEDFSDCRTLAVDAAGNVYVTGRSTLSWGDPIEPHTADDDAFVAKLSPSGRLQWNTFMGAEGFDSGLGIAVDPGGTAYVAGVSEASWGKPIHSNGAGGGFVAKLDGSGVRQWHTFVGDMNWAIAVDESQGLYVTGACLYLLSLNRDGALLWNTPLDAYLDEIALGGRHVYAAGEIDWASGTPVNPYAGGWDAFVAKVESNPPPADFYTVAPCRLLDSRVQAPGALGAGETRAITAVGTVGSCHIPADAVALALNVTVTQATAPGNLRLYASAQPRPPTSTLNYAAGRTRANNAVIGLSAEGRLSVHCSQSSGSAHFIVDVNGYFK